jgi:hypothetical protein
MMFVQMKQLVKEKDQMMRNLQNQESVITQVVINKNNVINKIVDETSQSTLMNLKKMTKLLELKIRLKEEECDELIRY